MQPMTPCNDLFNAFYECFASIGYHSDEEMESLALQINQHIALREGLKGIDIGMLEENVADVNGYVRHCVMIILYCKLLILLQ